MNQTAAHTPTPWKYDPEFVSAERKQTTGYFIIRDEDERFICKIEREVNAEFVVKACNSYHAMLEALEMQQMAEYDPEASERKGYFEHAKQLRETAIAKAKGGAA